MAVSAEEEKILSVRRTFLKFKYVNLLYERKFSVYESMRQ